MRRAKSTNPSDDVGILPSPLTTKERDALSGADRLFKAATARRAGLPPQTLNDTCIRTRLRAPATQGSEISPPTCGDPSGCRGLPGPKPFAPGRVHDRGENWQKSAGRRANRRVSRVERRRSSRRPDAPVANGERSGRSGELHSNTGGPGSVIRRYKAIGWS